MDTHPFMSIHPFMGQGYGWGHRSKSQCGSNILSIHIPFVPCQSALPFLRYSIFKIWPWKSRVKVMDEVTVQSHNVGLASYRFTSLLFHVNRPSHSWDTAFSKFDLENQGSRSWMRSPFKVTMWVWHPINSLPFCSVSIGHPIPEIQHFQNLTLKIKGQCQMTLMLHNYRSRQLRKVWPKCCLIWQVFGPWANPYGANGQKTMTMHNYRFRQVHETLNEVHPSNGFRDMRSAKSGPNLWQILQVFGPWASLYGANWQMTMTVHN